MQLAAFCSVVIVVEDIQLNAFLYMTRFLYLYMYNWHTATCVYLHRRHTTFLMHLHKWYELLRRCTTIWRLLRDKTWKVTESFAISKLNMTHSFMTTFTEVLLVCLYLLLALLEPRRAAGWLWWWLYCLLRILMLAMNASPLLKQTLVGQY